MKDMSMNYKNYIAWQEEVSRRAEVARRLRFAVFVLSMAVVAAAVWAAVTYGGEAVLRYEAQEQARMQDEADALQDGYDSAPLNEIERGLGK